MTSVTTAGSNSSASTTITAATTATSLYLSMPSRAVSVYSEESDIYPPQEEQSFDLLPVGSKPADNPEEPYSLEDRTEKVLGAEHLRTIFLHPSLLSSFADFLAKRRSHALRMLVYYLDIQKAVRAVAYANAITSELDTIEGKSFTEKPPQPTQNRQLQEMAEAAFQSLIEELSAYVTQTYIDIISHNMRNKITGDLRAELIESVDGLGESFCLTDPSKEENPIIFMSEEFNRVTQYGVSYAIGKNCRFLQGPRTDKKATARLREAIVAGRETSEVFMNYKRDGSPFLNLLMIAPLRDSQGNIKYFLGAQVDVSQLVQNGIGLEGMKVYDRVQAAVATKHESDCEEDTDADQFRELVELFNDAEIETAKRYGGRLHQGRKSTTNYVSLGVGNQRNERLVVKSPTPEYDKPSFLDPSATPQGNGLLSGVYQHYLLVRPYPSLRILFTSPSLRTPGIHQLHFMSKIGGSERVKHEIHYALRNGRGVTAKVWWITNRETMEGRDRFVHCTPLRSGNGEVGVWMIVVVDSPRQMQSGLEKIHSCQRAKERGRSSSRASRVSESRSVDRLETHYTNRRTDPRSTSTRPATRDTPTVQIQNLNPLREEERSASRGSNRSRRTSIVLNSPIRRLEDQPPSRQPPATPSPVAEPESSVIEKGFDDNLLTEELAAPSPIVMMSRGTRRNYVVWGGEPARPVSTIELDEELGQLAAQYRGAGADWIG